MVGLGFSGELKKKLKEKIVGDLINEENVECIFNKTFDLVLVGVREKLRQDLKKEKEELKYLINEQRPLVLKDKELSRILETTIRMQTKLVRKLQGLLGWFDENNEEKKDG